MARHIIKDGVKYSEEKSLFDNPNFREDIGLFLLFFVLVPSIAAAGTYISIKMDKYYKNKQESVQKQENKNVDAVLSINAAHLFKQKQR